MQYYQVFISAEQTCRILDLLLDTSSSSAGLHFRADRADPFENPELDWRGRDTNLTVNIRKGEQS